MTLKDELDTFVKDTFRRAWSRRDGQKVPETSDLGLGNDAVDLTATILYADLADSTGLVRSYSDTFAAEIYKNYLYCAARVIRARGGVITAYDGDRVMGVFIGSSKNTSAAKAALQINSVVHDIIQPALKAQYPSKSYVVSQRVGVDTSKVMVARTGIRGSNDLVWVGPSANNAAKMAALKLGYKSYITANIYNNMDDSSRFGDAEDMWSDLGTSALGYRIYGSNWKWSV